MADTNALVDQFLQGVDRVRDAFAGLTDADLDATPIPGTWTLRQIAFHLAQSDAIGVDRMLRVAFEQRPPLLIGYDETSATAPLFSADHPLDELLTLFELNRKAFARIARRLPADAWQQFGIHNEAGKVTLAEQLKKYVEHADGHLAFVRKKRGILGR